MLMKEQIRPECHYDNFKSNFNFHHNALNLTDTTFTSDEITLLDKGLNISFNNSSSNTKLLIAHTDSILNFVSRNYEVNIDYNKFSNIFKHCNPVNEMKRHTLESIKHKLKSDNLLISKADKGNCLVIQNRSTYIEETTTFLQQSGFSTLNKDPTASFHTKHKTFIKNLPQYFFEYFNLKPQHFIQTNSLPPRLYCLPKIHKPDIPYRPIVSYINSPTHSISP